MGSLILGVEDTGQVTIEQRPTNHCFYCFLRSFVLLLSIIVSQLAGPSTPIKSQAMM